MARLSSSSNLFDPLQLPQKPGERLHWGRLYGSAGVLAIASAVEKFDGLVLVVADDVQGATQMEAGLRFFMGADLPVLSLPDWETLPYDLFSPLPELVSERLKTLSRLGNTKKGVLVAPVSTLLQRLPPRSYFDGRMFLMKVGDRLALDKMRRRLEQAGYACVPQVMSHGEFAVRGSLLDLFPMGSKQPFRIDLMDDEIDTIRTFDPETQRTLEKVERIELLPAREFPLDEAGIAHFRGAYRNAFEGDPQRSLVYTDVSSGHAPGGIEYYLPLFFDATATLFDYLPEQLLTVRTEQSREQVEAFLSQVRHRYEQRQGDFQRPPLPPEQLYLTEEEVNGQLNAGRAILIQRHEIEGRRKGFTDFRNFPSRGLPPLAFQARAPRPAGALQDFLETGKAGFQPPPPLGEGGGGGAGVEQGSMRTGGTALTPTPLPKGEGLAPRVLFVAESAGRREMLSETLGGFGLHPRRIDGWQQFLASGEKLAIAIAPIEEGLLLEEPSLAVITESQLLGERVRQERRRRSKQRDAEQVVRNLTELHIGAPVVHEDHGVGRYRGLEKIDVGGVPMEFLALEYAKGDKLYVPVSSLDLISRYSGASPENAPLHRLGSDQWDKIKKKAAEQVRDVAAELLEIHARRAAHQGFAFPLPGDEYRQFAASFPFEETPDQQQAIEAVLADMESPRPMDRVVCGDVGFGKTEVAMRAAFVAVQGGRQVAVLVPTTLLAQQHFENFTDRFADWPVRVESLSRFRTAKEQKTVIDGLERGVIDIVVGTHKLLSEGIKFKHLGLAIVDEEHRFGVRHKERLKELRAEVDLLTLTATPIPRTLNMALAGMRDLSIIATPPQARHPIKTFLTEWNDPLIQEACQRELKRGGQVYFLHNEVETIEGTARKLMALLPEARVQVAHGQMRERDLEGIMRDFYHQRFNILVCTTIVESGIDVPSANTMLINRADKLGVAQLHQLRGRVGRSHHRAYAYLITPPLKSLTEDARKRLEAIESSEELGSGFTLATHDLEIRGAGELLGEDQSGQIQEIGFALYSDLLERAVQALKSGRTATLDRPLDHGAEIDLGLPALIPDDYLPDVHTRLVFYKRIAGATSPSELDELQVEMIDRFGLLPEPAKALFGVTELKLLVQPLGVRKLEAGPQGGRILFNGQPNIDPMRVIKLIQTRPKEFKMDGGDKIRFFRDMEERGRRIGVVREVVEMLAG